VGSLTSHNPIGLQGLLRDCFTLLYLAYWRKVRCVCRILIGLWIPEVYWKWNVATFWRRCTGLYYQLTMMLPRSHSRWIYELSLIRLALNTAMSVASPGLSDTPTLRQRPQRLSNWAVHQFLDGCALESYSLTRSALGWTVHLSIGCRTVADKRPNQSSSFPLQRFT
jgi:hypothetical protein